MSVFIEMSKNIGHYIHVVFLAKPSVAERTTPSVTCSGMLKNGEWELFMV